MAELAMRKRRIRVASAASDVSREKNKFQVKSAPFGADGSSSEDDTGKTGPISLIAAAAAASAQRAAKRRRSIPSESYEEVDAQEDAQSANAPSEEIRRSSQMEQPQRHSKYIQKLVKQASIRRIAAEASNERKIAKEREQEDHLYPDKEVFVTDAYKEKMAEHSAEDSTHIQDRARSQLAAGATQPSEVGKCLLNAQRESSPSKEVDNYPESQGSAREDALRFVNNAEDRGGTSRRAVVYDSDSACIFANHGSDRRSESFPKRTVSSADQQSYDSAQEYLSKTGNESVKPLRGLRRNDAASIEAYRQRYFARRDARKTAAANRTDAS